jgi:osmotically-inducible protein OsmY
MLPRYKLSARLAAGVFLAASAVALSGCAGGMMVGASATAGVALAQERTVGDAVDDKKIQLKINEGLFQHDSILFGKVDVEVVEGRVLLTGSVKNPEDRVTAARMTWKIVGVTEVLNEIQVSDRGGIVNYFRDAKITTQLRYLMVRDREINDINFTVETVNAVVYLMGISISQAELDKLTNHARNISGVEKVINHVVLKPRDS